MYKKALYLTFMSPNVQKLSFLMQNNAFLLSKWFPAYSMQGHAADTKTWATRPNRAGLRYLPLPPN
jgi:hypothetical protein